MVDRYVTVSDRDAFLTTRRLAETEGLLVGGSCGLAMHAALEVAAGITDPEAMVAVILPDGGRGYLSKIFNDEWMTQYGFLERSGDRTVGDVLRTKTAAGEIPPFVVVQTHQHVRDAITLLHEHRVSQLPVVTAEDPYTVVGSVGERGLLKAAMGDPQIMASPISDVMEAPFTGVSTTDPVREAVELLTGESQALIVSEHGRPVGIVTRTDLLESLGLMTRFATRAVHAGLEPDPTYRRRRPGDPPVDDLRAARAGRVSVDRTTTTRARPIRPVRRWNARSVISRAGWGARSRPAWRPSTR